MRDGVRPDRMPVWQINGIVASHHYGHLWDDIRKDNKLLVEVTRKFAREVGVDILNQGGEPNSVVMDLPGVEVTFPKDNYSNVMNHYFVEPEDVEKKELYDPWDRKQAPKLWDGHLSAVIDLAKVEKDYFVPNGTWGVITMAGFLRNVETLLMDFMLEPDLAHKAIERAAKLSTEVVKVGLDGGCQTAMYGDPTSSGSLISEDDYNEFVFPHMKKAIKEFKKYGAPTYLHVCGDVLPVINAIKNLKLTMFSFDYMNDVSKMVEIVDDRFTLAGNLNPMDVIWMGTPEKVDKAAKEVIEKVGDARFVLATGCETPRDTPIANLQAMKTAVEKYAVYK